MSGFVCRVTSRLSGAAGNGHTGRVAAVKVHQGRDAAPSSLLPAALRRASPRTSLAPRTSNTRVAMPRVAKDVKVEAPGEIEKLRAWLTVRHLPLASPPAVGAATRACIAPRTCLRAAV